MKVEEQHFETIEAYIEESPGWELDVLQLLPGRLDLAEQRGLIDSAEQ